MTGARKPIRKGERAVLEDLLRVTRGLPEGWVLKWADGEADEWTFPGCGVELMYGDHWHGLDTPAWCATLGRTRGGDNILYRDAATWQEAVSLLVSDALYYEWAGWPPAGNLDVPLKDIRGPRRRRAQ